MITVILKDGTEVPVNKGGALLPVSPHGEHDLLVSIYRSDQRVWTLGFLTTLRPGDFFRKLSAPDRDESAFLVTKRPRVFQPPRKGCPPAVHMEGLSLVQLSSLPPAVARLTLAKSMNTEVLTSHNRLLLE